MNTTNANGPFMLLGGRKAPPVQITKGQDKQGKKLWCDVTTVCNQCKGIY